MPSPIVWSITAGVVVLLCTSHLCFGIAIGRKMTCRDAARETREVLMAGISQSNGDELAAQSLLNSIERVVASQAPGKIAEPLNDELSANSQHDGGTTESDA
jgi:hypothetical protein